jgi:hypothetical protein
LQTIKENQLNGLCTNFVDDGITWLYVYISIHIPNVPVDENYDNVST